MTNLSFVTRSITQNYVVDVKNDEIATKIMINYVEYYDRREIHVVKCEHIYSQLLYFFHLSRQQPVESTILEIRESKYALCISKSDPGRPYCPGASFCRIVHELRS